MPDITGARFSEGDGITATCEVCGVSTKVALVGAYHGDVVDQALTEAAEWLMAHADAFHPDEVARLRGALDERMGPDA